jgi:single-stranded-DNA-specific exonuclease
MATMRGAKYLWKLPHGDPHSIWQIASSYNLSYPIAQLLLSRGYADKQAIDSFLFSSFEKDVAHASQLKDAQKAVDRILKAIANKEKILIFGDYDVDGITSSALMMISLLPLNADVNFYLPHRLRDGYGISTKIVQRAAQNNYSLIITVDNGITAFEPAQKAQELGIDLIITDHHKPHEHVPEAYAIINPNQTDCAYPFKSLAGVGVTFKLLSLLYEIKGLQLPAKAYELLLLGTIADVVPLLEENRFWVRFGLNYINNTESLSFKMLKQNGKITKPNVSATDIGFSIAPQINALGRLEDPRQGVKFLIGSDQAIVQEVGAILLELNQARKEIERSIVANIEADIACKKIDLEKDQIIVASSTDWTPGVIGLVASRFVGAYGKPTLLFHITKDGKAKGSCRSIPEFNMFLGLAACADLIEQFGGHPMAAGLSLPAKNLPLLKERLQELLLQHVSKEDLQPKVTLDAEVKLPDLTKKFTDDLAHLEPFGNQNGHPSFYIKEAMLVQKPLLLKDAHVKCSIFADGVIKPVIFFNRPELFDQLMDIGQDSFDLAVQVSENHWNGKISIELQGIDIAFKRVF